MTVNKRFFTIHYEDVVCEASVDCTVIRTLRDLLIFKLPLMLSAASTSKLSSTLLTQASQPSVFVDRHLLCSFGGQRLSLGTLTEVAPTTLNVTMRALRGGSGRKMDRSGGEGLLKRTRSGNMVSKEKDEDNDDDGTSLDYCNSASSSTNHNYRNDSEYDTSQSRSRLYWRRDIISGTSCTSSSNSGYDDSINNDDKLGYDCEKSDNGQKEEDFDNDDEYENNDTFSFRSKSIPTRLSLGECGAENDVEDDYIEDYIKDGRQQQAVLPFIVGGVVRLINLESRDKSHQWTVYIRGLFNETDYLAQCIESVLFILDPSFTPSERLVTSAPFELTEEGWGEFIVKMKVQLRHYPRPIQVRLSSSSFSEMMLEKSEVKIASMYLATQAASTLSGLIRGPVLSPVVNVLSDYCYYSHNNRSAIEGSTGSFVCNSKDHSMVKREVEWNDSEGNGGDIWRSGDKSNSDLKSNRANATCDGSQSTALEQPATATLHICSGVVMLFHLLRFSHRPCRPHCIPPLGRPYEPEEHVGYAIVHTPVITEQYDEIVVPDPPESFFEVTTALQDILHRRIAAAKLTRAMTQQKQQRTPGLGTHFSQPQVTSVYNEDGISCWNYIVQEGPDDAALAQSYLDSISATQSVCSPGHNVRTGELTDLQHQRKQKAQNSFHVVDPTTVVKVSRGRRKLAGAESDLAALKAAKKGLEDAIDKMRREITLRQAAHTYHQYT